MKLYTYYRSSAAYRVRIALNLKGLTTTLIPVNLKDSEQQEEDYVTLNAQKLIPVLELENGTRITQSLAIMEYLDETHPQPALLPQDPIARAQVRAMAQLIACDIHPLNNLRVLKYLTTELHTDEQHKDAWYHHWIQEGFTALETTLSQSAHADTFCFGNSPTLADICLVPQMYNARRFNVDLDAYPNLQRIDTACLSLDAFAQAAPEAQADAL